MPCTGGHGAEQAIGGVRLALTVPAPANDGVVGTQSARMPCTGGHGAEQAARRLSLTKAITTPAHNGAVGTQPARVLTTPVDSHEPVRQTDQINRPDQESGHLCSGGVSPRAVAQGLCVATGGDTGSGQGVDVGCVRAALNVGEPGRRSGRQIECTGQKRGHPRTRHRLVRAETGRFGGATCSYTQIG